MSLNSFRNLNHSDFCITSIKLPFIDITCIHIFLWLFYNNFLFHFSCSWSRSWRSRKRVPKKKIVIYFYFFSFLNQFFKYYFYINQPRLSHILKILSIQTRSAEYHQTVMKSCFSHSYLFSPPPHLSLSLSLSHFFSCNKYFLIL